MRTTLIFLSTASLVFAGVTIKAVHHGNIRKGIIEAMSHHPVIVSGIFWFEFTSSTVANFTLEDVKVINAPKGSSLPKQFLARMSMNRLVGFPEPKQRIICFLLPADSFNPKNPRVFFDAPPDESPLILETSENLRTVWAELEKPHE